MSFPSPRRRFSPARVLLAVVLTIVGLYGAAIAYLMTQETRLVFQAGRPLAEARPTFPYEQVAIPRTDGAAQFLGDGEPRRAHLAALPARQLRDDRQPRQHRALSATARARPQRPRAGIPRLR